MCLNVYLNKKNIPKGMELVNVNDAYFNTHCDIPDDNLVKEVMKKVDNAEYIDSYCFKGRSGEGAIDRTALSTGTKTFINIFEYPEVCFNAIECGVNIQNFFQCLNEGNILWELVGIYPIGDKKCNIRCNDIQFNNISDFVEYAIENYGE